MSRRPVKMNRSLRGRARSPKLPTFIFLCCMSIGVASTQLSSSSHVFSPHESVIGAVIESKGNLLLTQDILTVKLDVTLLRSFPEHIQVAKDSIRKLLNRFGNKLSGPDIINLRDHQSLLNSLLPPQPTRAKRDLFPVVGSALHALFGLATDNQLEEHKKNILVLQAWARGKSKVITKTVEAVNKQGRLSRTLGLKIDHLTMSLQNNILELKQWQAVHSNLQSLFVSCNLLITEFRSLITALTLASRGIVSPSLISPAELSNFVRYAVDKYGDTPAVPLAHIDLYYPLLKSYILGDEILVLIPFASKRSFIVYNIIPFPSLINDTGIQLDLDESLVAISSSLDFISFIPRSVFDEDCFSTSALLHICPASETHLYPAHHFDCIRSILVSGETSNDCHFSSVTVNHPLVAHTNNVFHLYFPRHTVITVNCPKKAASLHNAYGNYIVPDDCGVSAPGLQILPSANHDIFLPHHVLNYSFYQKDFSSSEINLTKVLAEFTTSEPVQVEDDTSMDEFLFWIPASTTTSYIVLPVVVTIVVVIVILIFCLRKRIDTRLQILLTKVRTPAADPTSLESSS